MSVQFKINCGFARVAIRQFSEVGRGKNECDKTTLERNEKFQKLFPPSFGVNDSQFKKYGHRESPFDRNCKKANAIFSKWSNKEKKRQYIEFFSPHKWTSLSAATKRHHSMENCMQCAVVNTSIQETFPGI